MVWYCQVCEKQIKSDEYELLKIGDIRIDICHHCLEELKKIFIPLQEVQNVN